MKQQPTHPLKTIAITFLLSWLLLAAYANTPPTTVRAAPLMQASCTLPATVTTADQLYDCITAANAGSGGTITLGADIDLATLTTSPLPVIESTIVLQGAGHAIDGGWDGVPSSGIGVRIFNVAKIANLTINQTTLKNGYGIPGGAIFNNGPLFVSNSTFSNNWGTGGGAIYNFFSSGVVTVSNSTFTDNIAETIGGAINNSTNGQVTVTNSTFSGNSSGGQGGAINNIGGEVRSTSNTFYGNSASNLGDAIYSQGTSGWRLYLAGNIFVGNISGDNCRFQGGTIDDNGYNLSDDATCTNSGTGSATNATLSLGALADRIIYLPYQNSRDGYFSLYRLSDAVLDPPHFSGGVTSFDAFAMGAPVVALPGRFFRGRQTWALYRRMEIDDCIARDGDHYVEIALRLAADAGFRGDVCRRIEERNHLIFDDPAVIAHWNDALAHLAAEVAAAA